MSNDVISELSVSFVHPDGRKVAGRIWIGRPEVVDEVESRCPVGLDGLWDRLPPISGCDTLQALLLAVRLVGSLLRDFHESGGQVLHSENDEPVDLGAYFGSLVERGSQPVLESSEYRRQPLPTSPMAEDEGREPSDHNVCAAVVASSVRNFSRSHPRTFRVGWG
jgi:hypothetical protein